MRISIKLGLVAVAVLAAACSQGDSGGFLDPNGGGNGAANGNQPGSTDPGAGSGTDPNGTDPNGNGNGNGNNGGPETLAPLAAGVTVSEVAVFQAVKISVAKSGAKVTTRNAPVIASRDALVRAYLAQGVAGKSLTAELRVSANGKEQVFKDTKTISAASLDSSLASTFNFEVPGSAIPVGATYSVAITDPSLGGTRGSESSPARYPADGSLESLDAKSTGAQLKIQLVPVQYNADGSGRLPDTSAATVDLYKKGFYKMYPVADVQVTVRAPYAWSSGISASGSGFSSILQAMVNLRQQDGAPADVYYMGIFAPASSFGSYCQGGCVTGLSGQITNPRDTAGRASVGIGYGGDQSVLTAVHEVGHAHGRPHSPCGGASGPDPSYPYSGGQIGVWGYDLIKKTLMSPTQYTDVMGYCSPQWISDYVYNKLFVRIATVNGQPTSMPLVSAGPRTYRFVGVEPDGRLSWGDTVVMQESPHNEPRTVRWLAADGTVLDTATGFYYPYEDLGGGYMLVPEPTVPFDRLQIAFQPSRFDAELSRIAR